MTIADKVRRAKNDLDKAHAAGVKEGEAKGGYTEGFEAGEGAIWDMVQQNGNRTDYSYAFQKWGCDVLHPKYKIVPTGIRNIVYDCDNLKKIEAKYFDMSQVPYGTSTSDSYYYCFGTCLRLEEIEDIGLQPNYSYSYFACYNTNLKKVACIRVDENSVVSNMLWSCEKLEDVTIEGTIGQTGINLRYSTQLSKASITSFVNALSEEPIYASGKSITFSRTAVNREFRGYGAIPDYPDPGDVFWGNDVDGEYSTEWANLISPKKSAGWTITLV